MPISTLGAAFHAERSNRLNFHRRFFPGAVNVFSLPLRFTPEIIGVEVAFPPEEECVATATAVAAAAAEMGDARFERRKSDLRDASSLRLSVRRQMQKSCKITAALTSSETLQSDLVISHPECPGFNNHQVSKSQHKPRLKICIVGGWKEREVGSWNGAIWGAGDIRDEMGRCCTGEMETRRQTRTTRREGGI